MLELLLGLVTYHEISKFVCCSHKDIVFEVSSLEQGGQNGNQSKRSAGKQERLWNIFVNPFNQQQSANEENAGKVAEHRRACPSKELCDPSRPALRMILYRYLHSNLSAVSVLFYVRSS